MNPSSEPPPVINRRAGVKLCEASEQTTDNDDVSLNERSRWRKERKKESKGEISFVGRRKKKERSSKKSGFSSPSFLSFFPCSKSAALLPSFLPSFSFSLSFFTWVRSFLPILGMVSVAPKRAKQVGMVHTVHTTVYRVWMLYNGRRLMASSPYCLHFLRVSG